MIITEKNAKDALKNTKDPFLIVISSWINGLVPNTRRSYSSTVVSFLCFVGDTKELSKIKPSDIERFKYHISPVSENTKMNRLACLKTMYRKFQVNGLIEVNPIDSFVLKLSKPKHHNAISENIAYEGLNKITIIKDEILRIRNKAIALLFLNNGLRRSEVSKIKVSDFKDSSIKIIGKGGRVDLIPINEHTKHSIQKWLEIRNSKSEFLFVSYCHKRQGGQIHPQNLLDFTKKYFNATPHQLRSRSITDFWNNSDQNIGLTQIFARHASPAITQRIYVQADKERIASAYQPNYK